MSIVSKEILTVKEILNLPLIIPPYQRPYKWQAHHVNQLIEDIKNHKDKSRYRLGTVVLHKDETATENQLSIVDGQQRLLTLTLMCLLLDKGKLCQPYLMQQSFESIIGIENLKHNAAVIDSRFNQLSEALREELIDFLLHKCELICIHLDDLSEAFQFFDSQNARGKELAPYDLLKAFHLREMSTNSEQERILCVEKWEMEVSPDDTRTISLQLIMSDYLYRIRRWTQGLSGAYFSRQTISEFKGVNLSTTSYRFTEPLRALNYMVDHYNADNIRQWDQQDMPYPFQINQTIINGKRFFEFIHYYINVYQSLFTDDSKHLAHLINTIDNYDGKNRVGDHYVRNLFYCSVLYYFDKFGEVELDKAAKLCFVWSYQVRLLQNRVPIESVDNHAMSSNSLFTAIKTALHPYEVLSLVVRPVKTSEIKGTKVEGLKDKFIELGYCVNDT